MPSAATIYLRWTALGVAMLGACFTTIYAGEAPDPAQIALGERLFLETRFAQALAAAPFQAGTVRGSDANESAPISCRTCHLVDEQRDTPGRGMRSYADFDSRSAAPRRDDHRQLTARNSQVLVNASLPRQGGPLFHYDGEFASMEDLVVATLTGRNHGWLANEHQAAVAHIAEVIRSDDGQGELAREFGGPYRVVLEGSNETIPEGFRLPAEYRINVDNATDAQIVDAVARLIAAYVSDLTFAQDADGAFDGSPYDRFLTINDLPRQAGPAEAPLEYSRRLLGLVNALESPNFVQPDEQQFEFHDQRFVFGPLELAGLKLFLREVAASPRESAGNCMSCHPAPNFTDFRFHNTGVTQHEYDAVHGSGAFTALVIPELGKRNANYDRYLPQTEHHPHAVGRFRAVATESQPEFADLGLWNVFANPDMPKPQRAIATLLCDEITQSGRSHPDCSPNSLLPKTIGRFKTPGLRNLGHSNPYMHSGVFADIEAVVAFYITVSQQARAGTMRNISEAVGHIHLAAQDVEPLVAFLRSLNEDYD